MNLRLIGIGLVLLAIAFAGLKVNAWRNRAHEADRIEQEHRQYVADVAARDAKAAEAKEADERRRERLEITLANLSAELEGLRARPITSVVYREKPAVDGKCASPRIGPEWVGVWNDAAGAATRAVSAAR